MKYREVEQHILNLIKESSSISDAIKKFLNIINNPEISKVVSKLSKYDYETDFLKITDSILSVLKNEKPNIKIKSYWFGIFETEQNKRVSYQAYISAIDKFNSNDESGDWAVNPKYFPGNRFINSNILIKIHSELSEYDEFIEIKYFALWYFTLSVGILLKNEYKLFLINTQKCFICIGFDEGDYNNIGFIDPNGLKINTIKISKPVKLKKTKTTFEYYAIKDVFKGSWFLEEIKQIDGRELVSGFSRICKPINVKSELVSSYKEKYDGIPVDYTEETLSGPVVSRKVMDTVLKHCKVNEIQFLPVTINNYRDDNYYIMNVLKSIKCLNRGKSTFYTDNYADKIVLNKSKINDSLIFRLSDDIINNFIFIRSILKDELETLQVTGIELIGIEIY